MADQWMYRVVGAEFGPVPQDELQQLLQEGLVADDDEVRPVDQSSWRPANTFAELGFQVSSHSTATATAERSSDDWYCKTFGTELGPLSFDDLHRMAENAEISADDEVRLGTSGKWRRVGSIGRLMSVLPFKEVKREVIRTREPVVLDRETSVGDGTLSGSAMATARSPVAPPHFSPPKPAAAPVVKDSWYAWIKGSEYGPVALSQLAAWLKSGQLSLTDHVREGTDGEYQVAGDVPGLGLPPGVQARRPAPAAAPEPVRPRPAPEPVRPPVVEPTPAPREFSAAPSSGVGGASAGFGGSGFGSSSSAPAWGNSSAGFGAAAPAFSRPAPAPAKKSKSSSSSGGGMSMPSIDFGVLFKNPAVLGVLAVAVLAGLWFVLPASQGADIEIYKKQKEWLTAMRAAEKDKSFASLSGKFDTEAKAMATDLAKRLSSSAPHRKFLMWNAKYRLAEVASGDPVKAPQAVKDFEANLKQAGIALRIKD